MRQYTDHVQKIRTDKERTCVLQIFKNRTPSTSVIFKLLIWSGPGFDKKYRLQLTHKTLIARSLDATWRRMIQLIFLFTFPKYLPFAGNGRKFLGYINLLSSYTGEDLSHKMETNYFSATFFIACVHSILISPFPFWYTEGEIKGKKNNPEEEWNALKPLHGKTCLSSSCCKWGTELVWCWLILALPRIPIMDQELMTLFYQLR